MTRKWLQQDTRHPQQILGPFWDHHILSKEKSFEKRFTVKIVAYVWPDEP